jgi:hypothetical protein
MWRTLKKKNPITMCILANGFRFYMYHALKKNRIFADKSVSNP